MNKIAKRIVFTGRVQGVGFRFTALNTANRYGLTGTVRNRGDGAVEIIAQGPADNIDDCIRDIEESFAGYISQTKTEEIPFSGRYKDFKITF